MNYIAVDDEPFVLKDIIETIREAEPSCNLAGFTLPSLAIEHVKKEVVDVAFLDIELGSTSGIELAKQLKDIQPGIHIIFLTSYEKYALAALKIHANGYLMKPASVEDVSRELTFLYGETAADKRIIVRTFGFFEVSVDGEALRFSRKKTKEFLAILIDRRGLTISTREACELLWEGEAYDQNMRNRFHQILKDLRSVLKKAGVSDLFIGSYNEYSINPELIDCDSYRFMEGDPVAVNAYHHDYLLAYSWAEFSCAAFEEK